MRGVKTIGLDIAKSVFQVHGVLYFVVRHGRSEARKIMRTLSVVVLSITVGGALGAGANNVLHAQVKPPAYIVTEADVTNADAYAKNFLPLMGKAFLGSGGKYLVRAGKSFSVAGEPPKRVAILEYENMETQAALTSAAFKEARTVGEKYAKFRTFAIEGAEK